MTWFFFGFLLVRTNFDPDHWSKKLNNNKHKKKKSSKMFSPSHVAPPSPHFFPPENIASTLLNIIIIFFIVFPISNVNILDFTTFDSFKERGACYALMMLSEENKRLGVISASLGNHAQALCYHGKRLNISVTVVMPKVAPIIKIEACRNFGATVIIHGDNMKESKHLALKLSKEKKIVYING